MLLSFKLFLPSGEEEVRVLEIFSLLLDHLLHGSIPAV